MNRAQGASSCRTTVIFPGMQMFLVVVQKDCVTFWCSQKKPGLLVVILFKKMQWLVSEGSQGNG